MQTNQHFNPLHIELWALSFDNFFFRRGCSLVGASLSSLWAQLWFKTIGVHLCLPLMWPKLISVYGCMYELLYVALDKSPKCKCMIQITTGSLLSGSGTETRHSRRVTSSRLHHRKIHSPAAFNVFLTTSTGLYGQTRERHGRSHFSCDVTLDIIQLQIRLIYNDLLVENPLQYTACKCASDSSQMHVWCYQISLIATLSLVLVWRPNISSVGPQTK